MLMLLPVSGWAQDKDTQQPPTQFTADINMMTRGEIRNGGMSANPDNTSPEDKSAFVLNRERLIFGFQRDMLEAKTSIQHVGTWGHEGAASVNVYEAWAKMRTQNGMFAQIGRLALRYDDERIIGSDDWVMASMTHDALRLGYEGNGHKVHTILAYNQNMRALSEPGSFYAGTYTVAHIEGGSASGGEVERGRCKYTYLESIHGGPYFDAAVRRTNDGTLQKERL